MYRFTEHFGAIASFDLSLPTGGNASFDYSAEFAEKHQFPNSDQQNINVRVFALQLGVQAYL